MKPLAQATPAELAAVRGVFTDIDETVSTRGRITSRAYDAVWRLHNAGFKVVPVTGRSAGWCDHIARFWPVDAVVGENGGFYFHYDGKRLQRRFLYDDTERAAFREKLIAVRERILTEVPGCGIASDQLYREYDLAIDFCEDVPALPRETVVRIQSIFEEEGAHAKISSIHVNGWFGDFDKLSMSILCAQELFGIDLKAEPTAFAFCGDSPNDEPMFGYFPMSFGMANVAPLLDLIKQKPAFITPSESGAGFAEVADALLAAKGK